MSDTIVLPGTPAPPANAQEARTRLDAFIADKERGAKLFAGDAATTKEFNSLTTMAATDDASTVAAAMAGNIGDVPNSSVKLMASTADMLREIGVNEGVVAEVLQGHLATAEEYKATEAWKARQMRDPVFVKNYLSGSPEEREKMTLADIILSGGIKSGA